MTDPRFLAHRDDPDVSKTAAVNVSASSDSEAVMNAVIDLLDARGPMTPHELERAYFGPKRDPKWPMVKLNTVQKRVSQMKKHLGLLIRVGRRDGCELLNLTSNPISAHQSVTDHFRRDAA